MRLLRPDELAERLAIPRSQVYRLAREGDLPAIRLGKYIRFDPADVDAWLDEQRARRSGPAR